MTDDISKYVMIAKLIWPIAVWVGLVNHRLKKLEKDVDILYAKQRGGGLECMRKRSIGSRVNRLKYEIRRKLNGSDTSKTATKTGI